MNAMPLPTPTDETRHARAGERSAAAMLRQPPSSNPPTLFAPLQALFNGRWRLQQCGLGPHPVQAQTTGQAAREELPASRGVALRHDHQRLSQLLADQSDLCHALRHLACVEQALARQGSRALRTLPEKVLARALEQLQGLTRDDPDFVLPELLQRLQKALATAKATAASATTVNQPMNPLELSEAMDVSEASHSLFDEMERSWSGHVPTVK